MLIHPTALIGLPAEVNHEPENHGVSIAEDVKIGALAAVVNGTKRPTTIGSGSRLLHRAHVGHDCILGAGVEVGIRATLCGFVEVGDGALIRAHALVVERNKIGAGAVIAGGAVVVSDVPAGETWGGVPARRLK